MSHCFDDTFKAAIQFALFMLALRVIIWSFDVDPFFGLNFDEPDVDFLADVGAYMIFDAVIRAYVRVCRSWSRK